MSATAEQILRGENEQLRERIRQLERELAEVKTKLQFFSDSRETAVLKAADLNRQLGTLREGVEKLVKEVENRNPISAAKLRALLK